MGTNHTTMKIINEAENKEIRQQKITNNQFPLVKRRIDEFSNCFYALTKNGAQFIIQNSELALTVAIESVNKIADSLSDETIFPRIVFKKKSKELISNYSEKHFIFNQDKMFSKEIKLLFPGYRLVVKDLDGIINEGSSSKNEIKEINTLGQGTLAVFFKQFLDNEAKINFTLLSQNQIFEYLKVNASKLNKKNTYVFFCKRNSFKKSSLDNIIIFVINKKDFIITSLKDKKIYKNIVMVF